jgi:hypothetical protein
MIHRVPPEINVVVSTDVLICGSFGVNNAFADGRFNYIIAG